MSRISPPLTTSITVPVTIAVLLLDLLDRAPGALVLGALLGQDQPALLVLLLEDQGLDLVADADDLGRVDVVLDRQLAGGDDALGLVPDVEQDLVPVDLDDRAGDDVPVVEVLDGLVDRGEELIGVADVVDGDLRRGGRLGRAGGHGGGTPMRTGCRGHWGCQGTGSGVAHAAQVRARPPRDGGRPAAAVLSRPASRIVTNTVRAHGVRRITLPAGAMTGQNPAAPVPRQTGPGANRFPTARPRGVGPGRPGLVGRSGGRLPGRARRVPRRRRAPASSGARRVWTRPTPACSATWPAGPCWRSAAAPPSARPGWPAEGARVVAARPVRRDAPARAAAGLAAAVPLVQADAPAAVRGRRLRRRLLAPTARCRSSPTRTR